MADKVKKNDIRWQRTERYLMKAFDEALTENPIEKIKVTDLAKSAEINKATFYLHYHDVYDLATAFAQAEAKRIIDDVNNIESFFTEPRRFVYSLIKVLDEEQNKNSIQRLAYNRLMPELMNGMADAVDKKFSKTHQAPSDTESSIVVAFFVHGVFGALAQYRDVDRTTLIDVLSAVLEAMTEHGRKLSDISRKLSMTQGTIPPQNIIRGKDGKPIPLRDRPNKNSVNYWMDLANRKLQ